MPKKTGETDAYKVFKKNLERARAFIRVFDAQGGVGQPTNDRKELLRGAVVFAIGSLDAFLHDAILEIVPRYGVQSKELGEALRAIAREDPSLALRVALKPEREDAMQEFREALDAWLSTKSFQGPEAVARACSYLGLTFDWKDGIEPDAAERLKRFSEERNDIVHRGGRPYIKRDKAKECIGLVSAVARKVNALIVEKLVSPQA